MKRAHVMVAMEIEDASVRVKSIMVYGERVAATDHSELFFEWFSVTGWNFPKAYENAVGGIAFYLKCRPEAKEAVLRACAPALRDEVVHALEA